MRPLQIEFPKPLVVRETRNSVLHYDFEAYSSRTGTSFIIPAGFQTDFASVPKWFRPIVHPASRIRAGAVLHDYLYMTKLTSKRIADRLLFDAAIERGFSRFTSHLIYYAVRIGGGKEWA